MSFAEARARLRAATFAAFGEAGTWNGAPARIRLGYPDVVLGLAQGADVVSESAILKVRIAEVAEAADGDIAVLLPTPVRPSAQYFKITGDPTADRRREVWICQARRIAA